MLKTSSRLIAFAAALAAVGAGAAVAGTATDATPPFQDCMTLAADEAGVGQEMGGGGGGHGEPMARVVPGSDGLASKLASLSIEPQPQSFTPGGAAELRFRIVDCDGEIVRSFEEEQTKLLHLIVVRTDFTGYQHLHPTLEPDGTWSVEVQTPRAGRYRAIADFVSDGKKYVLGTTLVAPGRAASAPLPPVVDRASSGRYEVELQRPAVLEAGEESQLTFRVTRDGTPVSDLEPYLGAYGHLVALHAPDLAYSHVHPKGEDVDSGAITFNAELHEHGPYRLFMQFRVDGRVRTVAFTQHVS